MEKAVNRLFYSELCKALITGNKNDLSRTDYDTFSKAGVAHVLTLSGLHISVILAVFYTVARAISVPFKVYTAGAVLLVVLYMALTGFSYSVFRAGVMTVFSVSATLVYERHDGMNGLFIALFAILLSDPYAIGDISFVMSFLSTLGIMVLTFALMQRVENGIHKLKEYTFVRCIPEFVIYIVKTVVFSVIITMSATLFTLPVLLMRFGQIQTSALFANILIVPLVSLVIVFLLLYIILSLLPFVNGFLAPLRSFIDLQADIIYDTAELFAQAELPVYRLSGNWREIVAFVMLVLLIIPIFCGVRLRYYFVPPAFLICASLAVLVLSNIFRITEVHCLSYMYSQNVIFRDNKDITVYKANGNNSIAVTEFCSEYGIDSLDTVIIPVTDEQYRRYFDVLFANGIKVKRVLHCPMYSQEEFCRRMQEYFRSHGVEFDTFEYSTLTDTDKVEFEVDMKSYSVYRFKGTFAGKSVFYGVNLYGHTHSPVYPKGDIALLYGEKEVISTQYRGDSEHLLVNANKYSGALKGVNTYDLSAAAGYIFKINKGKISMRSIG